LRRGVKYQNGEPFDARSVKFFYDTMNDPKNISPSKSNHTWVARVDIVDDHYGARDHARALSGGARQSSR